MARDMTIDDMHAEMRLALDRGATLSGPARQSLTEANQKCLDDLAFAIGKATRKDEESPIVRATPAPRVDARRLRGVN